MRITICGGGSLGHVCAGFLASNPDNEVSILSGHPDSWQKEITVEDCNGITFKGRLSTISSHAGTVIPNSDIVLLCVPGYLISDILTAIRPYIGNASVGSIVSSTGFFFQAHRILDRSTGLFGFQRVPFIARVREYGKSALLLGYKPNLLMAVENISDTERFRISISNLFKTPVALLDNYLEAALSNSNPILHTGRLYSMFCGHENELFDHNILFYKEWTDQSSQCLIDMDREFFMLLDKLDVHGIRPLLDYYESHDAVSLTNKISSIPAFQNILSPMTETEGGWKIDWNSRYFTEDFPFGLSFIKTLCDSNNIDAPVITKVYEWGIANISRNDLR